MGMAYLLILIVYVGVAVVIYKVIKRSTEKVWIKRLVIAFLILLPTYDIIITKALLFYYCKCTETEKVYQTVENPESVYFEDKVVYPGGYSEKTQKLLVDIYLLHNGNLKSFEVRTQKGTMVKYIKADDGRVEKYVIPQNQPTAKYSVVTTSDYINSYIKETRYEYFDLENKRLLGYIKGYYGKTPNIAFITATGSDTLGGDCSDSLLQQNHLIIKLTKKGVTNGNK